MVCYEIGSTIPPVYNLFEVTLRRARHISNSTQNHFNIATDKTMSSSKHESGIWKESSIEAKFFISCCF